MKQHCSFCVNNSSSGIFLFLLLLFWRIKYDVGNVLVWGWERVLPSALLTLLGSAPACGIVSASVSVVYLLLWHQRSWFALFRLRFFSHFRCIAHNSFLIRQLELIVFAWLYPLLFLTVPQLLAVSVFSCVLLRLTFTTKSLTKELLLGNPRCLV